MVKKVISQGIHDFKELIEGNYYYVDKSMFIHELSSHRNVVTVIPRPRRFGKTINMTMLKYFFEKPLDGVSNAHLFEGLAIANYPEIMAKQGTYPVIFITFKDIKGSTWDECYEKMINVITQECERHKYLLDSDAIDQSYKDQLRNLINKEGSSVDYNHALDFLSKLLHKAYKKRPIVLIDAYDTPIIQGFIYDYFKKVKFFIDCFFCAGLKDNNNLEFAIITGLLRIEKDSIFSGMNNSSDISILCNFYADKFGFVQDEVDALLEYFNVTIPRDEIKRWYNGYRIGCPQHDEQGNEYFTTVYHPGSIIECISRNALGSYLVNIHNDAIMLNNEYNNLDPVQVLLFNSYYGDKHDLIRILGGQSVTKRINDTIILNYLYNSSDGMWSFLVFTGYITWSTRNNRIGETIAQITLPNNEVRIAINKMIEAWSSMPEYKNLKFNTMLNGIIDGKPEVFLKAFKFNALKKASILKNDKYDESAYPTFTLSILASLEKTHEITINYEKEMGCYNLCIIPHDPTQPGTIIEFKRRQYASKMTLSKFAEETLDKIKAANYTSIMKTRGIKTIAKIGISFDYKLMAWKYEVEENGTIIDHNTYSDE